MLIDRSIQSTAGRAYQAALGALRIPVGHCRSRIQEHFEAHLPAQALHHDLPDRASAPAPCHQAVRAPSPLCQQFPGSRRTCQSLIWQETRQ